MPSITLKKSEFERLLGKKFPVEKLKDRISMMGTDLNSIEGDEIDVEIFPNRPDLLSLQGFVRAFASFTGIRPGLSAYKVKRSGEKVIIDSSCKNVRPYTACAIIRGIDFTDERIKDVIQIQEKLHVTYGRNRKKAAIGIYPCEKIKFPVTFRADVPGKIKFVPLEYDKELDGLQVLSKTSTGREFAHLLEGYKKFPYFIDSNDEILSMPPIINSHKTGKITLDTRDVFVECSGFDFNVLSKCLNIICAAFADMGGSVYSVDLVYDQSYGRSMEKISTPVLDPEIMDLDLEYINKLLGLKLSVKEAKKLLERMGFGFKNGKVLVPAYRADIMHQADLAEDIAIAYGYENFESQIPNVATIGSEDRFELFRSKIVDLLIGLGMIEVLTYNLTSSESQSQKMLFDAEPVKIRNSLSAEYNVLRSWVTPSIMEVLSNNKHNDYPQNIFGFGTVFTKDTKEETNIKEQERLAVALCSDDCDYTKIRQVLDYLLSSLGIDFTVKNAEHPSFIPGRVARVSVNGKGVAYIGEIHPEVLSNWDLQFPVAAFELNVTELFLQYLK